MSYENWTWVERSIYKFLAVIKLKKILGNICFSEQIFYRKQSLGAPVLFMYTVFREVFSAPVASSFLGLKVYSLTRVTDFYLLLTERKQSSNQPWK